MLLNGKASELRDAIYNAAEVRPDGLITLDQIELEDIESIYVKGASLPFPKLDQKLRGLRKRHLYTLAAREKAGKTLVTKEIALH
jgi:replicative DNA helicase